MENRIRKHLTTMKTWYPSIFVLFILFMPICGIGQTQKLKGSYELLVENTEIAFGNQQDTLGSKLEIVPIHDPLKKELVIKGCGKFAFVGSTFNDREMCFIKVVTKGRYDPNGDTLTLTLKKQVQYLSNRKAKSKLNQYLELIILESGDLRQNAHWIYKKTSPNNE